MYLKGLGSRGLADELKCTSRLAFWKKADNSIQNVFLVMNRSIRTCGNCDQRHSDRLEQGEMWIYISSSGQVLDLLNSARTVCETLPLSELREAGISFHL